MLWVGAQQILKQRDKDQVPILASVLLEKCARSVSGAPGHDGAEGLPSTAKVGADGQRPEAAC